MFKPKFLTILSLVVLIAAGYLAYWNQEKAKTTADAVLASDENSLRISVDRLNALTKELADTEEEDARVKGEIARLEKEVDEQKDINAKLAQQYRNLDDKVQYYKNNPDVIKRQQDEVRIARQTMPIIRELNDNINELNTIIDERQTTLDGLTADDNELIANHTALREHIESRTGGRSVTGLETSIRSVYNSWGFVTLNDGDKTGVVMNSTLDVKRDGETIAKLLVTIVEQDSASANIVPGSVLPDTFLMIGDLVVPSQSKSDQPATDQQG